MRVNVKKLIKKNVILGNGARENPYFAKNLSEVPCTITRSRNPIFYKDSSFGFIVITRSKDLVFTNCSFESLQIIRCKCLTFINCRIDSMILNLGYHNTFQDSRIENSCSDSIRENVFDSCELTYLAKRSLVLPEEPNAGLFLFISVVVLFLALGLPFINPDLSIYPMMRFVYALSITFLIAMDLFLFIPNWLLVRKIARLGKNKFIEGEHL